MTEVYIIAAKRTPVGGFLGSLANHAATQLGAMTIKAVYDTFSPEAHDIESVYFGNVLSAGLGQAPARQAAIHAGLLPGTDCTTINKVCASGLKAIMIAAQQIQLGVENMNIAGGMESMSNAPHYSYLRQQVKLGHRQQTDGLLHDGLTDAFNHVHMGKVAELCASEFRISREQQDEYALASYQKAAKATEAGKFKDEVIPVEVTTRNTQVIVDKDEDIDKIIPEKVPKLLPAFQEVGTITAANASNLNDGGAALLLASKKMVQKYNLHPLARIVAYADAAVDPLKFPIAPSLAIPRALKNAGLTLNDMDFIELNEAYAAVILANQKILSLDVNTLNVYGGAIAIGHPLGASGARIVCTLLSVLRQEGGRYGLAAICNGGGGASALIIENLIR